MFDAKEQWLGKDSTLELKRVVSWGKGIAGLKRFDLADELAAMADTHDGVIVLGVDDCTREVMGIPAERLDTAEAFVRENCNDRIAPPLIIGIARMSLPDPAGEYRAVLKIDVPRSLFVHRSPSRYFHLVDGA